jgi:hypothetical protein
MPNPSTPCRRATPKNGLTAVSGVARLQDSRPAAFYYPLGHPTLYAYVASHSDFLLIFQLTKKMLTFKMCECHGQAEHF